MCVLPKLLMQPVLKQKLLPQPFFPVLNQSESRLNHQNVRYHSVPEGKKEQRQKKNDVCFWQKIIVCSQTKHVRQDRGGYVYIPPVYLKEG